MGVDEIHHGAEAQPVDHVADRAAGDGAERDRHQRASRPGAARPRAPPPPPAPRRPAAMCPQVAEAGQQAEGDAAVPHHGQVQHRQQHDLAELRQVDAVQHPPFAGLVGASQHAAAPASTSPSAVMPSAAHAAPRRQTRPRSTASAQRRHSAGCAGWRADLRQHPPAAGAFGAGRRRDRRAAARPRSGTVRTAETMAISAHSVVGQQRRLLRRAAAASPRPAATTRACLAARAVLDRHGDAAADGADRLPLRRQRVVAPGGRQRRGRAADARCSASPKRAAQASSAVKHSTGASQVRQAAVQMVQHRARGAAAQAVRPVAIERVLADIEIERRQIGRAEIVQLGIDAGPVVAFHRARGCARPARSAGAAPSAPAPASRRRQRASASVKPSRRPAASAACCAGGDTARPAASGFPGRCADPRWCRTSSPTGAGCRRRICRRPPAAR